MENRNINLTRVHDIISEHLEYYMSEVEEEKKIYNKLKINAVKSEELLQKMVIKKEPKAEIILRNLENVKLDRDKPVVILDEFIDLETLVLDNMTRVVPKLHESLKDTMLETLDFKESSCFVLEKELQVEDIPAFVVLIETLQALGNILLTTRNALKHLTPRYKDELCSKYLIS